MNRGRIEGFTLVEMLVIVVLMAVMLGVLLPALTHARHVAFQHECQSHLRSIGVAMQSYASDYDGRFPRARNLPRPIIGPDLGPPLTMALIGRLRATASVFQCPGDDIHLYPLCGSSYFYFFSDKPNRDPAQPLLWDADSTVLSTSQGQIFVPNFHGERNSLFVSGDVRFLSEQDTPRF